MKLAQLGIMKILKNWNAKVSESYFIFADLFSFNLECDLTCLECKGPSGADCISCKTTYFMKEGVCSSKYSGNYILDYIYFFEGCH